jgi:hypothetical protein
MRRQRSGDFLPRRIRPSDTHFVLAPAAVGAFQHVWQRRLAFSGFPLCSMDSIIRSEVPAGRR